MITGAALATINRLPVLLLPGDIFARRNVAPVLQQVESPTTQDIGVNDCFKPVSRYWDRIYRPEQLIAALPEAMRVLTSPSDCGAVTLALAAGCADRGFRLSGRTVSQACMADPARRTGPDLAGACGQGDSRGEPAADCCRRRRADERSFSGARRVCAGRRAFPWERRRPAKDRWRGIIRWRWERSARRARWQPIGWRLRPMS